MGDKYGGRCGQRTPPRPATTLQQANAVLDQFCADYNQRFARPATEATRDFRSLPRRFDLARCLSLRYERVVGPDDTIPLDRFRDWCVRPYR